MLAEVTAYMEGREHELAAPVAYRNHVAQAVALSQVRSKDAEEFFKNALGDVDEPTLPFGLADVYGNGSRIDDARQAIDPRVARKIRALARRFGVSAATHSTLRGVW